MTSFLFDCPYKNPVSNSGHSLRFWELTLQHIILGATVQPITQLRIRKINGEE